MTKRHSPYPRAPQLIEYVRLFGHGKTYGQLSQEFQMPKSAVSAALVAEGLAPGGSRSQSKPITLNAIPWSDL